MINLSDRFRCIFIHVPKSAGTSIKKVLNLPGRGHPTWSHFATHYPHRWKMYRKFTVVRNPWDRIVSAYIYATTKESFWHNNQIGLHPDYQLLCGKTFIECCTILRDSRDHLKHESWYPQYPWIAGKKENETIIVVDDVLHFETIGQDFKALCRKLDIREVELPHINATNREHYRQYYNDATKKVIEDLYATDIELFGYKF